jgi:hypothetical protein
MFWIFSLEFHHSQIAFGNIVVKWNVFFLIYNSYLIYILYVMIYLINSIPIPCRKYV